MKFVLADTYRYWWPITVRVPHPDEPGKILEQTFKMEFEPQPREEAIAAQEKYSKLETQRDRDAHEVAQLAKVCKNWDDIVSENGGATAFTPENLTKALNLGWFRTAVYRGYSESLSGEEARLGN
ncbi:hypothetical protein N5C66_06365 [Rhizobium pusense]|uniref:hypothetical protein n=1 Tax=Agrobacterium pusense TaxID=648995 RepID=UPI00244C65DC|nr:hypothetical protein [Agrobacterium pusense]MDH1094724.1 hypothetical protein [Agrobacterium pusense]MDH1111351.1 hypothetical protein [Agrobacterium pusense]MDH2192704.1 hypothetical protein [Agrobacterium pusense]